MSKLPRMVGGMAYDGPYPIGTERTFVSGFSPHRPRPPNKFSRFAEMFAESPQPEPFAGIVGDEAPAPMKPLQPLKPRQFTPFTKPKDPIMDEYDDLPAKRGVPGARRVGEDNAETSPADDSIAAICSYLKGMGGTEGEIRDIETIWDRIHARKMPAMDSRRRAPRPMTAEENRRFNERFPDAARIRTAY